MTVRLVALAKADSPVTGLLAATLWGTGVCYMWPTMLAAVAEMERDLLVERTQSGLARAMSEGKTLGRPSKTTPEQRAEITGKYAQGESVSALARLYSVSRANILGIVIQAV